MRRGKYGRYIHNILTIIDLILVNMLFWILCRWHPEVAADLIREKWLALNVAYVPVIYWFAHVRKQRTIHMDRLLSGAIQAVGIHALFFLSLLSFLGADDIPTVDMLELYGMMIVSLPMAWSVSRLCLKRYRNHGYNFSRVVIVGTNPTAMRLAEALASDSGYGFRIMGFCDTERSKGFKGHFIGTLDMLDAFVRREHVDEIYYTLSGEKEEVLRKVTQIAENNVVKLYYVPRISPYMGRKFVLTNIGEVPVLATRHTPLNSVLNRAIKRGFDFAFSSVALILSPIVFVPVAIAVKMSSAGPVFFKQRRTGYRGREFNCWKFRTMRVNAGSDTVQATEHDPRKTKVGDFLRRTSIDELPQFINVWLGQMSVVGPRPHMLKHTEDYNKLVDRYMVRHEVKPGITGWAQVLGLRGQTDELWKMEKRVQADVWYIENWSFMLDIKIIVRTIINGFKGDENAF